MWRTLYKNRTIHTTIWDYLPLFLQIWRYIPDKIWINYYTLESFLFTPFNLFTSSLICAIKKHDWEYHDVIMPDNSVTRCCNFCGKIEKIQDTEVKT